MVLHRSIAVLLVSLTCAGAAYAQGGEKRASPPGATGSATKPVCVDAEVDGQRALSYDCLSAQLQPKPKPPAQAGASQTAAEAAANAPSNRLGTFNLSTERNRFGANWGKSVTPERPAAPVAVPPK